MVGNTDTSGREGGDELKRLTGIKGDCRGQDLAEYALLISLITLALIAAVTILGARIMAMFNSTAGAF